MRIGIDLGGTKIEAIALDEKGRSLARRRVPTPRGDYHKTVAAVVELANGIESELGAKGSVGVGIPGIVSPATGLVKNANSTWLIGRPLDKDLADRLERPVRLENDANCFALSETTDGAAEGEAIVFGVILGTGVGGGIVVDGRVLTGANAIAGEWGHNPLPSPRPEEMPGPACYCGRSGCIETFLCGPALENQFAARAGIRRRADEIAALAESGNADASAALSAYAERLARSLAGVINIIDPGVIVLGGGVSNIESLYESVPRLWATHVFSDHIRTKLARAFHGDSSGVRGAAWLWPVAP